MQSTSYISLLQDKIQFLESEQKGKEEVLRKQFYLVYESYKPVNIIASTLNDIAKSPFLIDNMVGTAMGLTSGFLTKKIFVGSSGSLIKKLLGAVLQFGVTNVVAQNSDSITQIGQFLFKKFIHRNENTSDQS